MRYCPILRRFSGKRQNPCRLSCEFSVQSLTSAYVSSSIPAEIDGSIDDLIKSHHSGQYLFAGSDTGSLAETLEIGGRSICGRLSSRAFILLFAILRLSEACMALQRALYLLAVSRKLSRIYEDHSPDVNKESLQEEDGTFSVAQSTQDGELTPLQRKKKKIGHELLNRSFSAFCNERISPFIRRWVRPQLQFKTTHA